MNTKLEKTVAALIAKFEAANWDEITITLKNSGHVLTIIPSAMQIEITELSDVEWFLVYGSPLTDLGGSSLERLAQDLIDYDQKLIELDGDKAKLLDFYNKHVNIPDPDDSARDTYSDWHKDVFGFRPGKTFGQPRY